MPSNVHKHQRPCPFSFWAAIYWAPSATPAKGMCTEQILALLTDMLHLLGDNHYSAAPSARAPCSRAPMHLSSVCHTHSWHYFAKIITNRLKLLTHKHFGEPGTVCAMLQMNCFTPWSLSWSHGTRTIIILIYWWGNASAGKLVGNSLRNTARTWQNKEPKFAPKV